MRSRERSPGLLRILPRTNPRPSTEWCCRKRTKPLEYFSDRIHFSPVCNREACNWKQIFRSKLQFCQFRREVDSCGSRECDPMSRCKSLSQIQWPNSILNRQLHGLNVSARGTTSPQGSREASRWRDVQSKPFAGIFGAGSCRQADGFGHSMHAQSSGVPPKRTVSNHWDPTFPGDACWRRRVGEVCPSNSFAH